MLAWKIALRYLFSKKSHGAVNIISIVSVAGVMVATAAILIVLSVFNGFSQLSENRLASIDPDIKIYPTIGKTIIGADSIAAIISAQPEFEIAMPVVEERGLVICGNEQMPVIFKGVTSAYRQMVNIDSILIDGEYLDEAYGYPGALLSPGVAMGTGARPNTANIINLYVPRRTGRINPANPSTAFRGDELITTGVFQIEQPEYDNEYMIIPIDIARDLLEYDTQATAIELKFANGVKPSKAIDVLTQSFGKDFKILTRQQQEESSFRMIMIEKWVTFLMLGFILVIASFNIISTLSLLVIEKRGNMATLQAIGAPKRMIRNIFIALGSIITLFGGVAGIIVGSILTLAQQWGGFIKLSGDPSQLSILVYPVRLEPTDMLIVLCLVAIVALAVSMITTIFTKSIKTSMS